jgi:hypothetical protein
MNQAATNQIQALTEIPEYVDRSTPAFRWYFHNFFILIASLSMTGIASLFLEYEIAKLTHPNVGFIQTPVVFDLIASGVVISLGLSNLIVLLFVFLRHLWLRKWMLATVMIGWMILAVMVLVLQDRFLSIAIP